MNSRQLYCLAYTVGPPFFSVFLFRSRYLLGIAPIFVRLPPRSLIVRYPAILHFVRPKYIRS
jgi:hypothetical protein